MFWLARERRVKTALDGGGISGRKSKYPNSSKKKLT
jgi:hypothetical protein